MQDSPAIPDRDGARLSHRSMLFAAALVAVFVTWMPASYSMLWRWMKSSGYYSHGLLIPVISIYLIWMRREDLKRAPIRRSGWGLLFLAAGILGQVVSAFAGVAFSSGFSMILVLMGLVWFVYGGGVFRIVAFPLCFLAFMVPLPMELLEQLSYRMKERAAAASTVLLRDGIGVPCARAGSTIKFVHTELEVGDPCSGLRSLIALMALGALVAYSARMSLWRRVLLFLCSVPFALVANAVRITVLALVAYRWGAEAATGDFVHYGTGFLVFFVAVVLLVGLWRLLRIGTKRPAGKTADERPAGAPHRGWRTGAGDAALRGGSSRTEEPPARPCASTWPEPLRQAAKVILAVAMIKALVTMFALEEVANTYVTVEHMAVVKGITVADLPEEERAEALAVLRDDLSKHMSQIRLQRVARGTIDVNYLLFTLVGLVFLIRGLPWARRYLQGLAIAGVAADVGFVWWLLRVEQIPIPGASAGVKALLVGLHLALYAGVSAVSLVWTVRRLSDGRLSAALGGAEAVEGRARGLVARSAAGLALAFGLAAVTWWLFRPAPIEAGVVRARNVPLRIGPWERFGEDQEPDPNVVETLETRDILTRTYHRQGDSLAIQLSVVFSQHNRRATHPPEICLRGSGWETDERGRVVLDVPRGPGKPRTPFVELLSKRGGKARLQSFYTFKAGSHCTSSYWGQQAHIFWMNLRGRVARGALVRFSATTVADEGDRTRRTLIEFMRLAMPQIENALESGRQTAP